MSVALETGLPFSELFDFFAEDFKADVEILEQDAKEKRDLKKIIAEKPAAPAGLASLLHADPALARWARLFRPARGTGVSCFVKRETSTRGYRRSKILHDIAFQKPALSKMIASC